MLYPATGSGELSGASQLKLTSSTSLTSPDPLKLTVAVPPVNAVLTIISCPVAAPATVGSNVMSIDTGCPIASVSGNVAPVIEKPDPCTVAAATRIGSGPDAVSCTVCVTIVFSGTFPKAMLVALMLSPGVPLTFNCKGNSSTTPPALAVSVTVCAELTEENAAIKLADVDPAATVTEAGTVTARLVLAKFTLKPPLGAALFSNTKHASVPAPVIETIAQLIPVSTGADAAGPETAFNCKANASVIPPAPAVNVATCVELTDAMLAVKLALVDPEVTVTEAGTVASLLLLAKLTVIPPLPAAPFSVIVQLSVPAPVIDELAQLSSLNPAAPAEAWLAASSCKANESAAPPALAVRVAICVIGTAEMVPMKLAEVDPAPTVIEAGMVTAGSLLAKLTVIPLLGAASFSVTVQLS